MITAFRLEDGKLVEMPATDIDALDEAVWIDLLNPTHGEHAAVVGRFGEIFAEGADHGEIEATSRYFEDDESVQVQLHFLGSANSEVDNVDVAAALRHERLITYHDGEVVAARLFRRRVEQQPGLAGDARGVFLGLLEAKVDHLADVLEGTYARLERLNHRVLGEEHPDLESALVELAEIEGRNGEVRLNLMDAQRVLTSLTRSPLLEACRDRLREVLRDVDSLFSHTAFLLEGITFLSGTVMGLINTEQNQIMKVLSIVAVVFLPPTLIASIYGMNFAHIPELSWRVGYPTALAVMLLLGGAPFWYAKRKGWM